MNKSLFAVVAVLALAPSAFADLAKATTVSETTIIGTGVFTNTGAFSNVNAIDGLFRDDSLTGGTPDTIAFDATLAGPTGGEYSLFLELGTLTSTVFITDIRFHNGAYNAGTNAGANAQVVGFVPTLLTAGTNRFYSGSFAGLTLNNGYTGADLNTFSHITFFVNFTAPGVSRLQIDYIANPEPGTMALFGLGAMALGGFALRRRNAKKAVADKA